MEGPPPRLLTGRTAVILLIAAILVAVAAIVSLTKPSRPDAPRAAAQPLDHYLARADLARGEAFFGRCAACHTIAQGGPASIGPNLYGVTGSGIAARPGFTYSPALRNKGGRWDWTSLDQFLRDPRAFAAGTRMTFAGISDPQDRADVMLYLNRQGGSLAMPKSANAR